MEQPRRRCFPCGRGAWRTDFTCLVNNASILSMQYSRPRTRKLAPVHIGSNLGVRPCPGPKPWPRQHLEAKTDAQGEPFAAGIDSLNVGPTGCAKLNARVHDLYHRQNGACGALTGDHCASIAPVFGERQLVRANPEGASADAHFAGSAREVILERGANPADIHRCLRYFLECTFGNGAV